MFWLEQLLYFLVTYFIHSDTAVYEGLHSPQWNRCGAVRVAPPPRLPYLANFPIPKGGGRGDDATCFWMGCGLVLTQPVQSSIWRSGAGVGRTETGRGTENRPVTLKRRRKMEFRRFSPVLFLFVNQVFVSLQSKEREYKVFFFVFFFTRWNWEISSDLTSWVRRSESDPTVTVLLLINSSEEELCLFENVARLKKKKTK